MTIVGKIEQLSSNITPKPQKGLCFRCDHRAIFLETGRRPRHECGEIEQCKYACYMHKPVKPVILRARGGDPRPQFGPAAISARSEYAGEPDMELNVMTVEGGAVLYWDVVRDI